MAKILVGFFLGLGLALIAIYLNKKGCKGSKYLGVDKELIKSDHHHNEKDGDRK